MNQFLPPPGPPDPYFFTPRQLAEHLLLSYPPDYKVSPARLKHSVILGNDVSGKVFLCAIPGPSDLESMLGVETLGARVWLWDEIMKMRRTSAGYRSWRKQEEERGELEEEEGEGKRGKGAGYLPVAVVSGTKRKREVETCPASRWAAVRTTPISDGSTTGVSETHVFKKRLREADGTFAPSISTRTPTGSKRNSPAVRPLRPRPYCLPNLPRTELGSILDPETLDASEITIMLRAIREIPAEDFYGEIVRAARVTAGPVDSHGKLPPSSLAIKEGKETIRFVREIAAVYASWILSKPYPLVSLEPGDVERMANFGLFLQFKVQFLNLLIPFESKLSTPGNTRNPTPTTAHTSRNPTPNTARASTPTTTDWTLRTSTPTPTVASTLASTLTSIPTPTPKSAPHVHLAKSNLVGSDLAPQAPLTAAEHDPETGWSLNQRNWGGAVVKKSLGIIKSWKGPKPKPPKPTKSHSMPWEDTSRLTPEALQSFVDWAAPRELEPEVYNQLVEQILEMESQLANGILKLERMHRVRAVREAEGDGSVASFGSNRESL
ncbi:hypothetical protein Q9L58_004550 [Maublancomyces gigas]|uniref:Uncharacterized protein n=1 Tax=Discina gigas TaxID=1032678 RepID=A0ABR3GKN9_9PEZI